MKAGWEQSYEWPANLLLVLFRVHEEIGWKIVVREAISGLQLGDYRRHRCFGNGTCCALIILTL